jgi:hypothetical protein
MDFRQYEKKRVDFFEKNQDELFNIIRKAQNSLYDSILKFILELSTDDEGNLKNTQTNVKSLREINLIVNRFNRERNGKISSWIIKKIIDLMGLNKSYFDAMLSVDSSVEARARRKIMSSLGYDEKAGKLIKGGYLDTLSNGSNVGSEVGLQINRAIALKMPLSSFQEQFKAVFTTSDKTGLGLLERHYYTRSFDLFQQYDRAIQREYADDLGLQYAIWNHTTKDTSTTFCVERGGNIYTRDEIESWKTSKHRGVYKIGYDPITHGHGYNCRSHISWISSELAEILIKTKGINQYNQVINFKLQ